MKQKLVWMSWINWFVRTVVNVRHRDELSRFFLNMLDIAEYSALVLSISLPLIQTDSKASHTAGDCFCTS